MNGIKLLCLWFFISFVILVHVLYVRLGSSGIVCGVCRFRISCSSYDLRRTLLPFFRVISIQMICVHLVGFAASNQVQFYHCHYGLQLVWHGKTMCGVCVRYASKHLKHDWLNDFCIDRKEIVTEQRERGRASGREGSDAMNKFRAYMMEVSQREDRNRYAVVLFA